MTKKVLIVVLLVAVLIPTTLYLLPTNSVKAAWFDDGYAYRQRIPIDTHSAAETNVYNEIAVDTDALTTDKLQADCDDIRFTKENGEMLPYQIVSGCDTATTTIRVGFDTMPVAPFNIYMYYGNPSALAGSTTLAHTACGNGCAEGTAATEEKAPSPFAYWKFDEGYGTSAQDSTVNNRDGTITGPTWFTEDLCIAGKCLDFDGSNDFVSFGNNAFGSMSGAFTISTWVKTSYSAASQYVLSEYEPGVCQDALFVINVNGFVIFSDGDTATNAGNKSVNDGRWHQIIYTYDGSNGMTYVDGIAGSDTTGASWRNTCSSQDVRIGASDTGTSPFNGTIDEPKIYKFALSAAQVKANYNTRSTNEGASSVLGASNNQPAALSNGLTGYWKMDETATPSLDASGNGNSGTWTATTSTIGKFGNGNSFDGTDDYIEVADSTSLDVTNVTLAAWVNPTALGGTIIQKSTSAGTDGYSMDTSGSKIRFCAVGGCVSSTTTLATASWQHISVTFDGITTKFYLNGVQDGTSTTITSVPTNSLVLRMGVDSTSANDYNGKIDESRVYNRALSPADVSTLYNFAPGPSGYWRFEEGSGTTANDASGLDNTGTLTNSPTYSVGKYGKGLNFAGSDAHIIRADDSDFDFGTGASFTYQAWVKHNTASALEMVMAKYDTTAGNGGFKLQMESDGDFTCGIDDDETSFPEDSAVSTAATYDDNNWHHVSCIKDGTSSLKIYIDGVLIATDSTISSTGDFANADPLYIGIAEDGTSNDWVGSIDEPKIYNYARTSGQVIEDMNAGHPAPGSPIGTPIGHWRLDEGYGTTANNSGNEGSITGTISGASWREAGKFSKALEFDGTDDVVTVTNANSIDFDTNLANHSFSAWIYADSDGENDVGQVYQKGTSTYLRVDSQSGSNLDVEANLDLATTDANVNVSAPITISGWNHLLTTWDGTTLRVYINGLLRGSGTGSGAISADANNLLIGGTTTANFDGKIDDFKVYNFVLTPEQIKLDTNRGQAQVLGALSDNSSNDKQAASQEYCIPGDSTSCDVPVARWDFEEGSGTTAQDVSDNANTGTISNATYKSGKIGKALNFDGSGDSINGGSNSTIDDLSPLTMSAWIYPETAGEASLGTILAKATTATPTSGWIFLIDNSGNSNSLRLIVDYETAGAGGNLSRNSAEDVLTFNSWYHVAVTWDGTSTATGIRFYVNGVETGYGTTTNGTDPRVTDNTTNLRIGTNDQGTTDFDGAIDHIMIYEYVRTPAQIAWEYNKSAPVGWWKMDECQGTTLNDSAGNSLTGTWTGTGAGTTSVGTCSTSSTAWGNGVSGKRNYSLDFDGSDDVVTVTNANLIDFDTGLKNGVSFAAWIYADSDGEGDVGQIIQKGTTTYLRVDSQSGSNLDVEASLDLATADATANVSAAITTGTWNHVLVTYTDDADDEISIYINGILRATSTNGDGGPATTDTNNLLIGGITTANFDGKIDDARVYNFELTSTQAKLLLDEGAVRFGPTTGAP